MNHDDEETIRRDVLREEREKRALWHQTSVSWGQFLVAVMLFAGGIVTDRVILERAITVIQERQHFVLRYVDQDRSDMAAMRGNIETKLDDIRSQLSIIAVELAKQQAVATDRGLRIPPSLKPDDIIRQTWKKEHAQ